MIKICFKRLVPDKVYFTFYETETTECEISSGIKVPIFEKSMYAHLLFYKEDGKWKHTPPYVVYEFFHMRDKQFLMENIVDFIEKIEPETIPVQCAINNDGTINTIFGDLKVYD